MHFLFGGIIPLTHAICIKMKWRNWFIILIDQLWCATYFYEHCAIIIILAGTRENYSRVKNKKKSQKQNECDLEKLVKS